MTAFAIDYVSNWAARLQGLLYTQFQNKKNWNLICTAVLGPQFQDLEDAYQSLLVLLSIDEAQGVVLDMIGRIVGQPRGGVDDPTYRLYLRARIAANRSDGAPNAIYAVFGLLFPSAPLRITTSPIKSMRLTIGGLITAAQAVVALSFLSSAKEAGVRALLEWQQGPDAQIFTTGIYTFCQGATMIGATTMLVDSRPLKSFPATGQVVLDGGLAGQETATYTSIDASGTMHFSAALTQAHAAESTLELVGDPGLGWGDNTNPATGGQFAGAAEAD